MLVESFVRGAVQRSQFLQTFDICLLQNRYLRWKEAFSQNNYSLQTETKGTVFKCTQIFKVKYLEIRPKKKKKGNKRKRYFILLRWALLSVWNTLNTHQQSQSSSGRSIDFALRAVIIWVCWVPGNSRWCSFIRLIDCCSPPLPSLFFYTRTQSHMHAHFSLFFFFSCIFIYRFI